MIKEEYKYHHIGLPTTIPQKNEQVKSIVAFMNGDFESAKKGRIVFARNRSL